MQESEAKAYHEQQVGITFEVLHDGTKRHYLTSHLQPARLRILRNQFKIQCQQLVYCIRVEKPELEHKKGVPFEKWKDLDIHCVTDPVTNNNICVTLCL